MTSLSASLSHHTVIDHYLGHCSPADIPREASKVLVRLEAEHKVLVERQRGIRHQIVQLAELSETSVADTSEAEEDAQPITAFGNSH
eukprot:9197380-Pyramimonas_sp.AAC.1